MKLNTDRFGTIEIDEEQIVDFSQGILGFEEYHQYVVIDQPDSIFSFLQSIDQPWLCFIVMMPELLRADYRVALEEQYVKELKFEDAEDGQVFVIVTVPEEITNMTANLQAPIVINHKQRLAKQIVLMDGKYNTRHNVWAELQHNAYEQQKSG